MADEFIPFLNHFSQMEDPRIPGMITYPLDEILLVSLVGVMCGYQDMEELIFFAESQLNWFKTLLPFSHGIPKPITLRRVLNALDSKAFEGCFASWVQALSGHIKGVIAVDGKTLRGSHDRANGGRPTHILSAFACERGLVLAQETVDKKSNEITAIPALLERLTLFGTVVTCDAMGTQKEVAQQIIDGGGDYLMVVKGNKKRLKEDLERTLDVHARHWDAAETTDSGHGRIDVRHCQVTGDVASLIKYQKDWPHVKSVARIRCMRMDKKTGVTTEQTRLYITSLPPNAGQILAYARAHWSIENNLHWVLDVTFREDSCRVHKDQGAANLATIRKAALNIFKAFGAKKTVRRHMNMALLQPDYRRQLLAR
jgi:predicted transposase YbfD/YdcC